MSIKISRRTLAKGAAWSAPVIVATSVVPAYAASRDTYGAIVSNSGDYTYSTLNGNCTSNTLTLTNSKPEGSAAAGVVVMYPSGQGQKQSVDVTGYQVVWYLPSGWVDGFDVTSGNFSYVGSFAPNSSTLTLQDGSTVSTSGLTAYVFKYNGTLTTQTQLDDGSFTPDPSSFFTADATGFSQCLQTSSISAYNQTFVDFTTADSFSDSLEINLASPITGGTA